MPPCAKAHGNANPPAPKMALMTLTMAAVSPVSPALAGAADDAADIATRSPRGAAARSARTLRTERGAGADAMIETTARLPPTTGTRVASRAARPRRGAGALAGRDSATARAVIAIAGIVRSRRGPVRRRKASRDLATRGGFWLRRVP